MRRLFAVAAAAVVSVALMVPAADAATTPVVSYKDLPAGWQNGSIDCTTSAPVALASGRVPGPATPPAGTGSLRIDEASNVSGGIEADFSQTEPSLSTLSAFDAYLYSKSSNGVQAGLFIEAYDPTTNVTYQFEHLLTTPDQWVHVDAVNGLTEWQARDSTGAQVDSGSGTVQSFMSAPSHANVKLDQLVVGGSCDAGSYYV
ncbi:MAG: hypothetical protein ACTHJM_14755, partial [Marmoricola sp.]